MFEPFVSDTIYLGKFGDSDVNFKDDWVEVFTSNIEALGKTDAATYDESTKTCKGVLGLEVEIVVSTIGEAEFLQNYIVGALIKGVEEEWTFTPGVDNYFSHNVLIKFTETPNTVKESQVDGLLEKIRGDLFYLIQIPGASSE